MNLTLSLLAGLLLLLPGIGGVAAWNHGGQAARRQELQLTSLTALFAILGLSLVSHLCSYAISHVVRAALVDLGTASDWRMGQVIDDPYVSAFRFAMARTPTDLNLTSTGPVLTSLAGFLGLVLLQTGFVFILVRNPGLDVVFDKSDLRGQGWAFQRIVRPARHGFVPYARVFTTMTSGNLGVGFEGVIGELRQGADGEIRSLFLAECSRFTFELSPSKTSSWLGNRKDAGFAVFGDENPEIEEGVALDASAIHHLVLMHLDEEDAEDVLEEDEDEAPGRDEEVALA